MYESPKNESGKQTKTNKHHHSADILVGLATAYAQQDACQVPK
jgi:hypothetical protein